MTWFYLQETQPINSIGKNDIVFVNTYLGGINPKQEILVGAGPKSFTGCIQVCLLSQYRVTGGLVGFWPRHVVAGYFRETIGGHLAVGRNKRFYFSIDGCRLFL